MVLFYKELSKERQKYKKKRQPAPEAVEKLACDIATYRRV